jgi:hypothetical protein
MRRAVALVLAAAMAVVCVGLVPGPALASRSAARGGGAAARIRWGKAEPVPGLAALNKGHDASVSYVSRQLYGGYNWWPGAISCWAAGGCAAGGSFTDGHGHSQAWVAQERKGRWGKAAEVPGTAALNKGGAGGVGSASCARTSVCVAVGTYTDKDGNGQWFTAAEKNGRWGTAVEVPVPALDDAGISTVWCAPGGLCAAGGSFTDATGASQAWVRPEVRGRWQPALEVPGLAALDTGGSGVVTFSELTSVSCASAGICAAGGQYQIGTVGSHNNYPPIQPFLVTETKGTWGNAKEVPGIETVSPQSFANASTIFMTCPSAGNCTAAGYYQAIDPDFCDLGCTGTFMVNERHGKWGQMTAEPGLSYVLWLTCPAAGDCVAAGANDNGDDVWTGELVSETNDHWGGTVVLSGTSAVNSVSCASPGYCAAGGLSRANSGFVISEWHGAWGKAITPAGIPVRYSASNPESAAVSAVACPPKVTLCTAGGSVDPIGSTRARHS